MKLLIQGMSDDLKEVSKVLISDNVKFSYKDNKITTDTMNQQYKEKLSTSLGEYIPYLTIKEK